MKKLLLCNYEGYFYLEVQPFFSLSRYRGLQGLLRVSRCREEKSIRSIFVRSFVIEIRGFVVGNFSSSLLINAMQLINPYTFEAGIVKQAAVFKGKNGGIIFIFHEEGRAFLEFFS